jgi:phosphatidylinositol alpha 1,6-mannosyltransferase
MATDRLLELFAKFDPQHIERIFGRECILTPPDPSVTLAPVRRVAIFAEAFLPKVDGVSKSAFLTLHYLQQTGRDVLVFAPDIAPKHIGSTRVIPLPSLGVPLAPETRMALPNPIIACQLQEFQPDLIHMFSPAMMSVSGMIAGRRMKVPIVANYQTDLPGYTRHYGIDFMENITRSWLRYIHNGCHLTLVPSNYTAAELRQHGFKRLRRWGRGVNGDRFHPEHCSPGWRERLLNGRDPDSLLCIYAGRLASEKRVDLLLEVARLPGVALTLIGDGAAREELEVLFDGTGTHFTGYLFGEDLPAALASADVFLFTGPSETFGQVVQEAMASGLPTIVTGEGGVRDLVIDEETGIVCAHNAEAFSAAVRRLRDDPVRRRRMAHQARKVAEQRPWEAILAQLEDHYREAIRLNDRFTRIFGETDYPTRMRLPFIMG